MSYTPNLLVKPDNHQAKKPKGAKKPIAFRYHCAIKQNSIYYRYDCLATIDHLWQKQWNITHLTKLEATYIQTLCLDMSLYHSQLEQMFVKRRVHCAAFFFLLPKNASLSAPKIFTIPPFHQVLKSKAFYTTVKRKFADLRTRIFPLTP